MKICVVGGGWAGLAAAVAAAQRGAQVTVLEAARTWGGRARTLDTPASGELDNGQHILIGAYTQTLQLMRDVGVNPERVLLRMPLTLRFPDGQGLALPRWPAPLDAAWGISTARGWSWADKLGLLQAAAHWQLDGFACPPATTVAQLCRGISPRVMDGLLDPLCVSALNTPSHQASGAVFLRVVQDSLFAAKGGSNLLLPRAPLGVLLPEACVRWLQARGADLRAGHRVRRVSPIGRQWAVDGTPFDRVVLACPPWEAARLAEELEGGQPWVQGATGLQYEAIATVYLRSNLQLPHPMLALRSGPQAPAQFVFDRAQLGGPTGLLAFVVSASHGDRDMLTQQVIGQAQQQLAPLADGQSLQVELVKTVVEKRATFACTPGLLRPPALVAPGLLACGDYVAGPYPATLEGAVRSGQAASRMLADVS